MALADTVWHCESCDGEYPTAGEADDCAARDRWAKKLEDNAGRMYEMLLDLQWGGRHETYGTEICPECDQEREDIGRVKHDHLPDCKIGLFMKGLGIPPAPRKD